MTSQYEGGYNDATHTKGGKNKGIYRKTASIGLFCILQDTFRYLFQNTTLNHFLRKKKQLKMSFPPYNQSDRSMVEVTLVKIILQNVARVGGNTRTHFFAQNNVLKAVLLLFIILSIIQYSFKNTWESTGGRGRMPLPWNLKMMTSYVVPCKIP